MIRSIPLACIALAALAGQSQAATLNFTGTALASCALITPVDGTLTLGGDLMSWTTLTPAAITAVNTSSATLTTTQPSDWLTKPASTPTTTFTHTAAMTGTNIGNLTGTGASKSATLANIGATVLTVSLGATASSPFRAGLHVAQVTVTCTTP